MLSDVQIGSARVIYSLLKNGTTQQVIKSFLKERDLAVSAANSDELFDKRILPALIDGTISLGDFRDLLKSVEECGRQHVFVFRCAPARAAQLISRARVESIADGMGLKNLISQPLDLDLPPVPTLVEIRIEEDAQGNPIALVLKQVESRDVHKLIGMEEGAAENRMHKVYAVEKKRAVNIARLCANGEMELRIASQDNTTRYSGNVASFFVAISDFLPRSEFHEVSLSLAKARLLSEHASLKNEIRYGNSEAVNEYGRRLGVSTSSQEENVFDDDGLKDGLGGFLAKGGLVSRTNLYFKIHGSSPAREVHVLLSGAHNEFAIPVGCTPEDFGYVCEKIREFNSPLP